LDRRKKTKSYTSKVENHRDRNVNLKIKDITYVNEKCKKTGIYQKYGDNRNRYIDYGSCHFSKYARA
jgi:hypothetical protein